MLQITQNVNSHRVERPLVVHEWCHRHAGCQLRSSLDKRFGISIELRKETDMLIQSHMIILDIVGDYPPTDPVFREYDEVVGKCLLCHHLFDSIESVAKEYQLDEQDLLRKLNEAAQSHIAQEEISQGTE